MRLNRRRVCATGGVFVSTGLAGCLFGGDDDSESEMSSEDETSSEEESSEDDSDDEPSRTTLERRVDDISAYLSWMVTDYWDIREEYQTTLREASTLLDEFRETAPSEIDPDDVSDVIEYVERAGESESEFREHYTSHWGFRDMDDELESDLQTSLERQEYDSFEESLDDHYSYIRNASRTRTIDSVYSPYLVTGAGYDLFTSELERYDDEYGDQRPHIFETRYSSDEGTIALYALSGEMDISKPPFMMEQTADTFAEPDRYRMGRPPYLHRDYEYNDLSGWLSSDESHSEIWMNISLPHLTLEEWPFDYIPNVRSYVEDETVDDVDELPFEELQMISVYIQEFEDTSAAESVYQSVLDRGVEESERELLGETYTQTYYIDEELEETVYADVLQSGRYLIGFDLHSTQWEDRDIYDADDAWFDIESVEDDLRSEGDVVEYEDVLEGTWLDNRDAE